MAAKLELANLLTKLGVDTSELKKGQRQYKNFTKGIQKGNKDAQRSHNKLDQGISSNIKSYARMAAGIGVAVIALRKITQATTESVKAYAELDRQMRTTEQLLRATGNTAGKSIDQLDRQAREIGRSTLASTQQVRKAQNILLTFKNISGTVFDDLLESAQDFATILGTDITQTTQQLAKAFEDPAANLSNLRRIGISFSEEEKDRIKTLQEQNKLYEAQVELSRILKGQAGGAGRAAAGGIAGQLDTLGEEANNLKEVFGGVIAETRAFKSAVSGMTDVVRGFTNIFDLFGGEGREPFKRLSTEEIRDVIKQYDNASGWSRFWESGWGAAGDPRNNPLGINREGAIAELQARGREAALANAQAQQKIFASQSASAKAFRERMARESRAPGFGTMQDPDYTPYSATGIRSNFPLGITNLPNVVNDPTSPTGMRIDRRISTFGVKDRYEPETRRKGREDQAAADKRSARINAKTNEHMASLTHLFNLEQEQKQKLEELEQTHGDKMMNMLTARIKNSQAVMDANAAYEEERQRRKASVLESIGMGSLNSLIGFEKMTLESSQQAFQAQAQIFGSALQDLSGTSKRHFQIFKNLQTAQAIIGGIAAAIHSYNYGTQIGGPWLGGAMAAMATAAMGLQVAKIQTTEFQGRRAGGTTQAGRIYQVNEAGPEMFSANGKDYMMAGTSGRVTPANRINTGGNAGSNEVKLIVHYAPESVKITTRENGAGNIEMFVESMENMMADRISSGKSYLAGAIAQVR